MDIKLGYQIYSAREDAEKDLGAVCAQLKEMGYDGVEFAGFYGNTAEQVNEILKKTGLAANYPFATIDPNVGIVDVPDSRLQKLADIVNPGRIVPATVEFVDIAGLVKGANEGEGLGNQFLANIRETDAIAEVVRFFGDPDLSLIHI